MRLFLTWLWPLALWGNWADTSTGIDLDKLPRFPLKLVRLGWLQDGQKVSFDGISAVRDKERNEVRLRGTGKSGKAWEVGLHGLDEVWRGDLDRNGNQDYVLFASGPYLNGRVTALYSLCILMMDEQGLPVPFFTAVHHGDNGQATKAIVDLDRDGRGELILSSYDEIASNPRMGPFCSGHWVSQLYRLSAAGAAEFQGTMGGLKFPFIHDWADKHCVEDWPPPYPPLERVLIRDHGTARAEKQTTRIIGNKEDNRAFVISRVSGCAYITPRALVYDQPRIRRVAFPIILGSSLAQADLAAAIQKDRSPVTLRGIDRWGEECMVNLAWATQVR